MTDSFKTIADLSTGLYKEKGSRFMAFAYPVKNESEIKDVLKKLNKEYHDARHICYAWVLGPEKERFRANDDGEPSGTGGKPILNQIQSFNLTNILVAVVRYFGGTLLGTSGLLNAYRTAAADALANASILDNSVNKQFRIRFPYEQMNSVLSVIKEMKLEPVFLQNDLSTVLELQVPVKHANALLKKISLYKQVEIEILDNID